MLSIIIPCFNEQEVLRETLGRLLAVCDSIKDESELIFVDDGSSDDTREILRTLEKTDPRVKVVGFSRNFGHQTAVTAGIDAASGDAVVLIDADLQDPPELIVEMYRLWKEEGYDVIYGQRTERAGETRFKKLTAHWFYKTLNRMSDVAIPLDVGDFRLMDRKIVDTLNAMPEQDRFIRGLVSWSGFRQKALPYSRAARFAGVSKYPLRKMLKFATTGILSFSTKPLQLSMALGFCSALLAFIGIIWAFVVRIVTDEWIPGWTSILLAVLFIGGIQLICLGVLGEYVGRIYNQSKSRPLYVTDEYLGFGDKGPHFSRSPTASHED